MSIRRSEFPEQVWDGISDTNDSRLNDREPDYPTADQYVAEIIAVQQFVFDTVSFLATPGVENTILGVDGNGIGYEFKQLVAGTGITIQHTEGQITISSGAPLEETLRLAALKP